MRALAAALIGAVILSPSALAQETLDQRDEQPLFIVPTPSPPRTGEPELTPLPATPPDQERDITFPEFEEEAAAIAELLDETDFYVRYDAGGAPIGIYTVPAGEPLPMITLGAGETIRRVAGAAVATFMPDRARVYEALRDALSEIREAICDLGVQPSSVTAEVSIRLASVTVVWDTQDLCGAPAADAG